MTTSQLAQAIIKAHYKGEVYSIQRFLTAADSVRILAACFSECDKCSLGNVCESLSFANNGPDHTTSLNNAKPVYDYIKHNYPEYLI